MHLILKIDKDDRRFLILIKLKIRFAALKSYRIKRDLLQIFVC
jgi:hypothetical protein